MYRLGSVPRHLTSARRLGLAVLKHIALRYTSTSRTEEPPEAINQIVNRPLAYPRPWGVLDVDQASVSNAMGVLDPQVGFAWFGIDCPKQELPLVRRALAALTLNYRGRIMTYVLIVVSWLGGTVNGAGVSTQEFSSVERCEAARIALVADAKARALEDQLRPICLQK